MQKGQRFYSQGLAPSQDGICSEFGAQHTLIVLWLRGTLSLSIEFSFFFFLIELFLKSNSCVYWFSALTGLSRIFLKDGRAQRTVSGPEREGLVTQENPAQGSRLSLNTPLLFAAALALSGPLDKMLGAFTPVRCHYLAV